MGGGDVGGDSSAVAGDLSSGVTQIYSNGSAFAALKADGSVVTWGDLGFQIHPSLGFIMAQFPRK